MAISPSLFWYCCIYQVSALVSSILKILPSRNMLRAHYPVLLNQSTSLPTHHISILSNETSTLLPLGSKKLGTCFLSYINNKEIRDDKDFIWKRFGRLKTSFCLFFVCFYLTVWFLGGAQNFKKYVPRWLCSRISYQRDI